MNRLRTRTRKFLLVALAIVLLASLGTGFAFALYDEGSTWESTPEAVERESQSACPAGMTCKELCYFGEPQGMFRCFYP